METQLRKDILEFLTPLPSLQTENGRRAILLSAGLDAILAQTDLSGPPGVSVPLLVNALELYGTVGETPALIAFLQEIARQVGQDKQRQIQDFCGRLTSPALASSAISPPPQERPPSAAPQTIITQGDYFENVGGNIYTGPVTIHSGGGRTVSGENASRDTRDTTGSLSPSRMAKQDISRVFICYAEEDKQVARRLYADLQQAGVKPWMDSEDLLPGQNWKLVISQVIKDSSYVIALLSSHSLSKRGFIQKEMRRALDMVEELPPGEIFVIPVRLDECTPLDERLQELHWVDLFPSYEEGLQRILRIFEGTI